MRTLWPIVLLALAACSAEQQVVTVPPRTCVADVQDEPFVAPVWFGPLVNKQIAQRNTQRRAYARAHQSPDCPAETAPPSEARPSPYDDGGVAAAIEQGNMQNWLSQQQNNFWQMQNWQAQEQQNFWDMVGAMR